MNEEFDLLNQAIEESNLENGGMDSQELQGNVRAAITDAVQYIDDYISPNRAKATKYYRGEPFGNEEDGRSTVVDMTVRDTVGKIMPALLRVFFGTEKVVEFVPQTGADVAFAGQATDYVNHILTKDNNLFLELQSCWQDALVRKVGVLKYFWEENPDEESYTLTNLDEQGLIALQADPELQVNVLSQVYTDDGMQQQGITAVPTFSVHVTYKSKTGRVKVKALPCEEFIINREATSLEDATLTAHRRMATVSELVKMGYDFDFVKSKSSGTDELEYNVERRERNNAIDYSYRKDDSQKLVEYVEAYVKVDWDNDGIAELRKICCMGSDYEIVHNQPFDRPPFATFCPSPESHVFFGQSIYDLVGDIQKIKSNVLRNSLDSLSLSIHPRVAVVEGQANLDDVLSTEVGAVIRQSQPGAVTPFNLPFVGKEAFPMLGYLDTLKENRTGISKASQGLDAENLQSTTQMAVNATIKGAQAQIEMIARIFAETGMKELFQGVLKLVVQHQDYERVVRLRDAFTPIDPRPWNSNMDVSVNVALGAADEQEKIDSLSAIISKQEDIINKFGPNNPLVSLEQYRNALSAQMNLAGFKNTSAFMNEGPVELPPPPPPKPTAEEVLAQVQAQSIQADMQKKAAELQLKHQEMMRDDDYRQDKLEADITMQAAELKAKYPSIMLSKDELLETLKAPRENETVQ
tara:strand:+ start:3437 stop:5515 length:2079 start_codon:yes stop_codon:yes gene_type:complete